MSEVTALEFRDRLFTAFDTFWAGRTLIAAPNVDFDPSKLPDDATAWVRLYILGSTEGQGRSSNSVSRNHWNRSGAFTIEVYVRQGGDLDEAYTLAEAAMEFLEKPDVADAWFTQITPPQEFGPDGAWFQVTVAASWVYWTDRAA
jgi:hypothetical protein